MEYRSKQIGQNPQIRIVHPVYCASVDIGAPQGVNWVRTRGSTRHLLQMRLPKCIGLEIQVGHCCGIALASLAGVGRVPVRQLKLVAKVVAVSAYGKHNLNAALETVRNLVVRWCEVCFGVWFGG